MLVHKLTKTEPAGQRNRHYRDGSNLEVDAVVELPGGEWAAFEVKLGATREIVGAAAASLIALLDKVNAEPLVALGAITGTGHGTVRPDGVLTIPIGSLGP